MVYANRDSLPISRDTLASSVDCNEAVAMRLLLRAVAQAQTKAEFLDNVVRLLKELTSCAAVGIRITDDYGNIPYQAHEGFSNAFLQRENWLNVCGHSCVCTRVINQAYSAAEQPVLSKAGSFFVKNGFEFVTALSAEQRASFRGSCVDYGYATILVTPILVGGLTVGAIHIVDQRINAISLETVESIELLAPVIGQAIRAFGFEGEAKRHDERLSAFSHMASALAHEIRNPLTTVKGFAQLLTSAEYDAETRAKYLAIIKSEVDHASTIIEQFLEVTRRSEEPSQLCSISHILQEVADSIVNKNENPAVEFQLELCHTNPWCFIRPNQLANAFSIIVQNALDAMPNGGLLRLESGYSKSKEAVWAVISDTGCGVSPEDIEKLGLPFFTTKPTGSSLGLSLSSCYAIVREHGGWVEVDSLLAKGTTFRVYIPCPSNVVALTR